MDPSGTFPDNTALAIRDRVLGPSLLGPFADYMAQRLARLNVGALLEIAADTGALTGALARVMSADVRIVATDNDPAAVSRGAGKPGMARIAWQRADPTALPFANASFDVVACLFGAALLPDRVQAFRDVRRVLRGGGRFLFAVPARIRHAPLTDQLQTELMRMFPASPPKFLTNGLHGYADNEEIDDDLTAAGFTDAVYTTIDLAFSVPSARDAAIGLSLGTKLSEEIEAIAPGTVRGVAEDAGAAMERHFGTGPISSSMRAHVISASG